MDTIPIAQLEHGASDASSKAIRAVVTLIWPYSSSTRRAALLLAEPDFRLRKNKGQVRVQLAGAAAQAVAQSKISSGDEVLLRLEHAQWVEAPPGISTPGKSVDIELRFRRQMQCEIFRNNALWKTLLVDDQTPSEPPSRIGSPSVLAAVHTATPYHLSATPYFSRINSLSTPASSAFHRRARVVSGDLVDSPYDPFASNTEAIRHGRKRQRLSWGTEGHWTVNDNLPTPTRRTAREEWVREEDMLSPSRDRNAMTSASRLRSEPRSPLQQFPDERQASAKEIQTGQDFVPESARNMDDEDGDELILERESQSDEGDENAIGKAWAEQHDFGAKAFPSKFTVFRDDTFSQSSQLLLPVDTAPSLSTIFGESIEQRENTISLELATLEAVDNRTTSAVHSIAQQQAGRNIDRSQPESQPDDLALDSNKRFSKIPQFLQISDMPPPALPPLQISQPTTGNVQDTAALPSDSPRTPDLKPQQASALPLPSPFEELGSFVDFDPQVEQSHAILSSPIAGPPVLPDWMLQIGFGFGSQGFDHSSSLLEGQHDQSLRYVDEQALHPQQEKPADSMTEAQTDQLHMFYPKQDLGPILQPADTIEHESEQYTLTKGDELVSTTEQVKASTAEEIMQSELDHELDLHAQPFEKPTSRMSDPFGTTTALDDQSGPIENAMSVLARAANTVDSQPQSRVKNTLDNDESTSFTNRIGTKKDLSDSDQRPSTFEPAGTNTLQVQDVQDRLTSSSMPSGSAPDSSSASTLRPVPTSSLATSTNLSPLSSMKTKPVVIDLLDDTEESSDDDDDDDGSETHARRSSSQAHVDSTAGDQQSIRAPLSPVFHGFDGAMDSKLETNEFRSGDVSYPVIPSQEELMTTSTQEVSSIPPWQPLDPEPQVVLETSLKNSNEALLEQTNEVQPSPQSSSIVPSAPHRTQSTAAPVAYETHDIRRETSPSLGPRPAKPEEIEQVKTPMTRPRQTHAIDTPSVLSPWFGTRSSLKSKSAPRFDIADLRHENKLQPIEGVASQDGVAEDITDVASISKSMIVSETSDSSAVQAAQAEDATKMESGEETDVKPHQSPLTDFSFTQSQSSQARGLLTNQSYYTPLSNLFANIRIVSNSHEYNDNCVDVIAVVSKATTRPLRADKGQRDFHTTLSVTDKLFYPRSLRVQVFRPWRDALPRAEKGDVVLLRAFEVFSAKGNVGVGLKSQQGSAWCVWHFSSNGQHIQQSAKPHNDEPEIDGKPWTRREKAVSGDSALLEDIRGPPVEFGQEERDFAQDLKAWWDTAEPSPLPGHIIPTHDTTEHRKLDNDVAVT